MVFFTPVQYAAIAALMGPDDFIEEQRRQYASRNKTLCGGLRRIGWDVRDSQGTMFVWAKIPEGYASSVDFCMKLMERTGVIVTREALLEAMEKGMSEWRLS